MVDKKKMAFALSDDDIAACISFTKKLNEKPDESFVMERSGFKYLPIGYVQTKLDEFFSGLVQTKNFRWECIGNEIVGGIDLYVFHPILGEWIVKTGSAATQVRIISGKALSLENKIKNALEMDFPHLKADCITSAAKELGRAFGRDLNREQAIGFDPLAALDSVGNIDYMIKMMEGKRLLVELRNKCIEEIMEFSLLDFKNKGQKFFDGAWDEFKKLEVDDRLRRQEFIVLKQEAISRHEKLLESPPKLNKG